MISIPGVPTYFHATPFDLAYAKKEAYARHERRQRRGAVDRRMSNLDDKAVGVLGVTGEWMFCKETCSPFDTSPYAGPVDTTIAGKNIDVKTTVVTWGKIQVPTWKLWKLDYYVLLTQEADTEFLWRGWTTPQELEDSGEEIISKRNERDTFLRLEVNPVATFPLLDAIREQIEYERERTYARSY